MYAYIHTEHWKEKESKWLHELMSGHKICIQTAFWKKISDFVSKQCFCQQPQCFRWKCSISFKHSTMRNGKCFIANDSAFQPNVQILKWLPANRLLLYVGLLFRGLTTSLLIADETKISKFLIIIMCIVLTLLIQINKIFLNLNTMAYWAYNTLNTHYYGIGVLHVLPSEENI